MRKKSRGWKQSEQSKALAARAFLLYVYERIKRGGEEVYSSTLDFVGAGLTFKKQGYPGRLKGTGVGVQRPSVRAD